MQLPFYYTFALKLLYSALFFVPSGMITAYFTGHFWIEVAGILFFAFCLYNENAAQKTLRKERIRQGLTGNLPIAYVAVVIPVIVDDPQMRGIKG